MACPKPGSDEEEKHPKFQDPGSDEEEIRSGFRKAALDKYKKDGDVFWLTANTKRRKAMAIGFKDISWPVLEYEPLFPAMPAFVMPDKHVCCGYGSKRDVFSVNYAREQAKSTKGPQFAQLLRRETGCCPSSKCNGHVCAICRIVSKSGITLGRIPTGVVDKARWQPVGWQCANCKKGYFVQPIPTTSTVELNDKLQMVPVYRYINHECTTKGCVGKDKRKSHFNTRCEILNPYNNSLGRFPQSGRYRQPADAPNEAPVYLQARWLWDQIIIPARFPAEAMVNAIPKSVLGKLMESKFAIKRQSIKKRGQTPVFDYVAGLSLAATINAYKEHFGTTGSNGIQFSENQLTAINVICAAVRELEDHFDRVDQWANDFLVKVKQRVREEEGFFYYVSRHLEPGEDCEAAGKSNA